MILRPLLFLIFLFPLWFCAQDNDAKRKLASDYFNKGVSFQYSQKDSTYHYLDLAYSYSYQIGDYSDALEIVLQCIFTSGQYSDMENNRFYLDKLETILQNASVRNKVEYFEYYRNRFNYEKGSYLFVLKDFEGAKKQFLNVYDLLGQKDIPSLEVHDLILLVHATNFLASVYMDTGKYDLAENYFNRSLTFSAQNKFGKEEGLDRATNRLLAKLNMLTGKYGSANKILVKLLDEYKTLYDGNKRFKNSLITVYQRSVNNLMLQDSLDKALMYLNESQQYLIDDDPFIKHSLLLYGDIYSKLGKEEQAMEHYMKALDVFEGFRQNTPHQDIAEVYGKIAELQLKQKKYQEGLKTIQKAFKNVSSNVQLENGLENPNPEEVFSKTQLLNLLDAKHELLSGLYRSTGKGNYLETALRTERDLLETFELLKKEFDSKLDKQFLAEKAYPMFGRMLDVVHMAYDKDGSDKLLELALTIAEKGKDFILLEALRNAQATQYGNVPQTVLDKEARLRAEISYIEKKIFEADENEPENANKLFTVKQEYYGFLDTIKINHPKYYELKYQNTPIELVKVRKEVLKDDAILISYTMTESNLYAIVLGKGHTDFLKLPFLETDREAIRNFNRLLSKPSIDGGNEELVNLGELLFKRILNKSLEGLETENLTIIPDGELHYLPFDLLRKDDSYLLKTISIGYGNSVASLMELKAETPIDKNKVLAFAPSFTGAVAVNPDRQFGKLLYNDDEVSKIGTFYDTETVLDKQATLANFRAKTPGFNVLHLATHASANDKYPDYSYLAFAEAKDSSEGNILYIKDLYNTSINADMVTLSACQTGIGKLQKGQGMLSLSKGFYYAGAKSLVNTLWKINDKSTVTLMDYFYEGLSEGKSKAEALRTAKLRYLQTTEDNLLKHPYYWGGFVVSGDISPITEVYTWYYWVAGSLAFLLMVFFILKRKTLFSRDDRRLKVLLSCKN